MATGTGTVGHLLVCLYIVYVVTAKNVYEIYLLVSILCWRQDGMIFTF
uniref:Uncharacterized protein n=1 Tax=Arundo donax TaxID=35708 RepID=A0A0A9C8N3_ARUDO